MPQRRGDHVAAAAAGKAVSTLFGAAPLDDAKTGAATTLALAEAAVQSEARRFFVARGYDVSDASAASSRTALIAKNLPAGTTADELRRLFGSSAGLDGVHVPESGLLAILEFSSSADARKAFKALAYRRFKSAPLYLDWAPKKRDDGAAAAAPYPAPAAEERRPGDDDEAHTVLEVPTTLFVKNVAFETTEARLAAHFAPLDVRSVRLPKAAGDARHKGYGFVEFACSRDADAALRSTRGPLDGRALDVARSAREATAAPPKTARTKLVVRNLAFAATVADVRGLFAAFGPLRSVRVPKRADGRTRGFAFVAFERARDAAASRDALASAHLYGRHLVLEWADEAQVGGEGS